MVLYLLTVLSLGFCLLVDAVLFLCNSCFITAIYTHISLYDKSSFLFFSFPDDIGAPKISYPQVLVFSYHSYVILDLTVFIFFGAGGC
jgi:hypothetical protein